jgi:hypothetical protein
VFSIEDEIHAEHLGEFASFDEAVAEPRRLANIPWDRAPNVAPCTSWKTCGREYVVIESDDSHPPGKVLRRTPVLEVSASGAKWASGFEGTG